MTATPTLARNPTSTADVVDRVRDASARCQSLRIVGGGSWLDANRPVRAFETLVIRDLAGIVEYEPGDLTLTARAGTTLDEIMRATAPHGQWLTLDPPGDSARATIGATIATASYGPLAHHFGTPRDMTLGVEFVTGAGDIVRGGGRVVKNVAGFDLTRLVTGSWGTLGVLTEATLRLRALPAVETTVAIDVGGGNEVERAWEALHALPFTPLAAQLLDATLARALGVAERGPVLLVRLGGNEEAVRAQREQLRTIGDMQAIDGEPWRALRVAEPSRAVVLRMSRRPSLFAASWVDAARVIERWPSGYGHGDPGRGVVRVVLPFAGEVSEAMARAALDVPFDGTRIFERLPAELWDRLAPSASRNRLDRDIKATFDPTSVLNPGILGTTQ